MGRFAAMALGVVTAVGGFVDMGELVTMSSAGATYRYSLLWAVALAVVGAMSYAEMAGRIELVSQRTVFQVMRERLGFRLGLVPLLAVMMLNLLTLAAEIAGLAFVIQLGVGVNYYWLVIPVAAAVLVFQLTGNWKLLENVPSFLGLPLLVVPAALTWGQIHVDWGSAAHQLVTPHLPSSDHFLFALTAISLVGAIMSPYEWYFYSSGGREERWTPRDLIVDRVTAVFGFALGSVLAFGLMIGGATLFFPRSVSPGHLSQVGLIAISGFGQTGLVLFLLGAGGCVLGASIEVSQSTAQALAQFFGWSWGASKKTRDVPAFTIAYGLAIVAAVVILLSGVDPVKITVISMIFAVTALPFTFLPMMLVANDDTYMGEHRNGALANTIGWLFLTVLTVAGIAAIPLLVITGAGGG
jgi:Mn2+/Fe2+ NRAMP family transporter